MKEMNALRQEIRRRGCKLCWLAEMAGKSAKTLSAKLNGKTQFNLDDIILISKILSLTPAQRDRLFFGDEEEASVPAVIAQEEI